MRSKVRKFFTLLLAVSLLSGTVSGTALAETASGDLADYQEEAGAADTAGSDGADEGADQVSGDDSWKYSDSSYEVVKGIEANSQEDASDASPQEDAADTSSQDGLDNVPSLWHASSLDPDASAANYNDFDGTDEYYQKMLDDAVRLWLTWNW